MCVGIGVVDVFGARGFVYIPLLFLGEVMVPTLMMVVMIMMIVCAVKDGDGLKAPRCTDP